MQSGIIKGVILMLVLVVFALLAGSAAAGDSKMAMVYPAMLVGAVAVLYLGKSCWILVFLLPPLFNAFVGNITAGLPLAAPLSLFVLGYWILLSVTGRTRFTWNGMWMMDLSFLLIGVMMVASYIRFPVTIAALDPTAENVGGSPHVWWISTVAMYIAMSVIPYQCESLLKVIRWYVLITLFCVIYANCRGLFSAGMALFGGARVSEYLDVGFITFAFMISRYRYSQFFSFPGGLWKSCVACASLYLILVSGYRSEFIRSGLIGVYVAVLRRDILIPLLVILGCLGGIYGANALGVLSYAPYSVQRTVSILPGLDSDSAAAVGAKGSTNWRLKMWEQAMDPSSGRIYDYVWGDGFVIQTSFLNASQYYQYRNYGNQDAQREHFMETGNWHNGAITAIHRVGYVGLALMMLFYLVRIYVSTRVGRASLGLKESWCIIYLVCHALSCPVLFVAAAGSFEGFFQDVHMAIIAKLLYAQFKKQGLIKPLFERRSYVPMMHRTIEEKATA